MSDAPRYVLYEHAVGYALLRVKEFEDIGLMIPEVEESVADVQRFCSIVKLVAFEPFKNTEAALENCNCVAEGVVHQDLVNFLEANLGSKKKKGTVLGVNDGKLAGAICEVIDGIRCLYTGVVTEIVRGIRVHFGHIAKDLPHHSLSKAQLSLGHSYSRGKVKFDVHRVDNMVIQSIALLDQLDKDINLFGMRIREWYSYHFPELYRVVSDQYKYVKCASAIMDRKKMDENVIEKLKEIMDGDEQKVQEIVDAAHLSMGMEISELDLLNIERFALRVASLSEYRQSLHQYIKDRMSSCAPSLSALIGEQVGARLISHAGSLTNLAKYPASTVQILGAEKALFRALKTRSNTPKYGLLFHSSFIGRASAKNKGRISRFLANKCAVASRIDCFSDVPVSTYGEFLKQQVEDRLKYFETGEIPKKNLEVMKEAIHEAEDVKVKVLRKRKKAAKKAKKEAGEKLKDGEGAGDESVDVMNGDGGMDAEELEQSAEKKKKKKHKKRSLEEAEMEGAELNGGEKRRASDEEAEPMDTEEAITPKKKKKRHSKSAAAEEGAE